MPSEVVRILFVKMVSVFFIEFVKKNILRKNDFPSSPESVKTRNDVFYLQPERSCVPDSPVWYSTQALGKESLCKMLHRVKMVKEINIALLTS